MKKYLLERTRSKVSKAIEDFRLISAGDKILVAVSGGKDSMAMLDILNNRKKALKIEYSLKAIHIRLTDIPYSTDEKHLEKFCHERNIEFELIESDKKIVKPGKQACFYCAWNRRKLLFEYAKEQGFNKLALGHHMDDAVETLFMNMIYHGELSSFPVKIGMFDNALEIIRPLIYLKDKEINRYINYIGYKPLAYDCLFAENNKREKFREILSAFSEIHPKAIENIFKSMNNINEDFLPLK